MADKLAQAESKKAEGNKAFAEKDYETAIARYSEVARLLQCLYSPLFKSFFKH